jgi:hypothetical protein
MVMEPDQLDLFEAAVDLEAATNALLDALDSRELELGRQTIQERFEQFHRDNPHVYLELERLTYRWVRRNPGSRLGIGMLFEVMRWRAGMRGTVGDDYKLNNNFRSRYVRMLLDDHPDLEGLFELRELKAP